MLAVSAAAEFLRCSEAAHLVCTCNAFNPGLRDRIAAGSREDERDQDIRDAAAAAAAAAAASAPGSPTDTLMELWSRVVDTASTGTGEWLSIQHGQWHERDDDDDDQGTFDFDEDDGFAFGDVEGYGQY